MTDLELSVTAQERVLGHYNPGLLNLVFIIALSLAKYSCGYLKKNFFLMFIFERKTRRDRAWVGEGQRGRDGDTESKAGARLWLSAQSPLRGSNSQTVRSWPKMKSDTQQTGSTRCLSTMNILAHECWCTRVFLSVRSWVVLTCDSVNLVIPVQHCCFQNILHFVGVIRVGFKWHLIYFMKEYTMIQH